MDCWVTGRCTAKLIGGRELFDGSSIDFHLDDVNSVNKSNRIKHYVYWESEKTLDKLVVTQIISDAVGVQSL